LALDRDATLKKAEKLVRQGRLDLAIAEYVRIVDDNPGDWSTANTLGELYAKAGQTAQAIEQYTRIAGHFAEDGFYPKAAALYKKVLKLKPNDEAVQIELGDISAKQGLLADAKSYLNTVAARRKARGDSRGAAEIVVRLGDVDPSDYDARLAAARMLEQMGDDDTAGARYRRLYDDLLEKGRPAEAVEMLKELVRLKPLESDARATLAKTALANGPVNVTLGAAAATAGADASGNPLLFAPNPVQLGSSISHWDTSAYPNQLMEPAINCNLTHSVNVPQDLTMEQLRDIGWE